MPVKPIPDTSPRVIPMLVCRDPEAEIEFCERVLKAEVGVRRPGPDGNTVHAALVLGEARIIIQAEFPQLGSRGPRPDGSSPVVIFLYVDDVDRAVEMTLAAGGSVLLPAQNQFWGDRSARVMDPSGHVWTIATRMEETSEDQRTQRLGRHPDGPGPRMSYRSAAATSERPTNVARPSAGTPLSSVYAPVGGRHGLQRQSIPPEQSGYRKVRSTESPQAFTGRRRVN